jgi:hypothetical protein
VKTEAARPEQHVSGLYTNMLMDLLTQWLAEDEINDVLARAGETRVVEDLNNVASWNSYEQFKRLLKAAKIGLQATPGSLESTPTTITLINHEIIEVTQSLGSPGCGPGNGRWDEPFGADPPVRDDRDRAERMDHRRVVRRRIRALPRVL